MDASRLLDLEVALQRDQEHGQNPGFRLCRASVDLIAVTGAGIVLMDDGGSGSSFGVSDDRIGAVEDLQFTFGEGPGIDAHSSGRAVFEPELADPAEARWSAFAPAAVNAGVLAAFGFPLRVGAIRIGALDLYCDQPGALRFEQMTDGIAMARVISQAVIEMKVDADHSGLAPVLARAGDLRVQVHQASGMISRQLNVSIGDALVRLRARAYAEGRPINDMASEVVDRRLRFE